MAFGDGNEPRASNDETTMKNIAPGARAIPESDGQVSESKKNGISHDVTVTVAKPSTTRAIHPLPTSATDDSNLYDHKAVNSKVPHELYGTARREQKSDIEPHGTKGFSRMPDDLDRSKNQTTPILRENNEEFPVVHKAPVMAPGSWKNESKSCGLEKAVAATVPVLESTLPKINAEGNISESEPPEHRDVLPCTSNITCEKNSADAIDQSSSTGLLEQIQNVQTNPLPVIGSNVTEVVSDQSVVARVISVRVIRPFCPVETIIWVLGGVLIKSRFFEERVHPVHELWPKSMLVFSLAKFYKTQLGRMVPQLGRIVPHDRLFTFTFDREKLHSGHLGQMIPFDLACGKFGSPLKNQEKEFSFACSNPNQIHAVQDRSGGVCEAENLESPPQTDNIKSLTQKWKNKLPKKVKKMKKKVKKAVKATKKSLRKGARFLCCMNCETGTKEDAPGGLSLECNDESHTISLRAFYPCMEHDNKRPPDAIYGDEYERWTTFHRLGNQRLPTQTLARNGLFYNADDEIECHSCHRVSELSDAAHHPASGNLHYLHCRYAGRPRQVSSDTPGRVSDDIRDPPGQQSIYIPPGDVRVEAYRVSTFENFPVPSTSSRRSLAQAGFFFTGFYDRVKCFACGRTVQEWEARDNPADRKWHKDDCPFMRGENCGNVPITTHFNQIYGNLSTRPSPRNPGEEVIQQRDPVTGAVIRTVRYPADLPERIRQTGGTFEIGPNNQVTIQSGPGAAGRNRGPGLQEAPARLPATPLQQSQHQPMRNWRMANVISADHKRFLTNLYLNRELDRVASFARWPTGRPNVAPAALAKTGFFYLGDMDRTQCFSCGGVLRNWTAEDDAASEHRAHFPNCRLLLGTETRNVPVPDLPVPLEVRQRDFPCRFPSNPHMRGEAARVETFDQRWPRNRTAATPAEIAQAGFFYLGERDRVKCWYCNGGLQHWEYDDVPWIEHAKWFPNCQYLLSVKGQHFVYRHLAMCPQLPRPIIARQDGSPLEPGSEQQPAQPPEDIPPSAARVRQPSPPPTIIDPQEEMRKKQERIDNVMKNSDIVKNVLAMGFSEQIVRQLLVEKVDSGTEDNPDDIYGSAVVLLEDVMNREQEMEQEENQRSNVAAAVPSMPGPSTSYIPSIPSVSMPSLQSSLGPAPGSGKYNVSYFGDEDEEGGPDMYGTEPMAVETSMSSETPAKQIEGGEDQASLQEALNKIEEERMCKVCFSNPADMVFVPCGHMCCCMECTQALRQCPVCRVKIQKAIKTYLS